MFEIYGWQPGIGDPTVMGWVTVGAYILTAMIALWLTIRSRQLFSSGHYRMQRSFWLLVCILMLFLGLNKQLDLQSLITSMGRYYVVQNGWLEYKRNIQVGVIISILLIMGLCLLYFAYHMNALLKTNWLAIAGLTCLLVFIVSRATSFHQLDIFISTNVMGLKVNWLLELGGLTAIVVSAIMLGVRNVKQKSTGTYR